VTVTGDAGVARLRNQNGVVIDPFSTTQGADLKLAAEGTIRFVLGAPSLVTVRAVWLSATAHV